MSRLHSGYFDSAHEKFAKLDLSLNKDTEKTRLRTYTVTSMCELSLNSSETKAAGDILVAGVSYGTAPLVMSHVLRDKLLNRTIYLLDPFLGVENSTNHDIGRNYNLDSELVKGRMPETLSVSIIREFLTPKSIERIKKLVFVHLNTTDFRSELDAIPAIYKKLLVGGFIVVDLYGWLSLQNQNAIDQLLLSLGAQSFECVTRQLIIYKSS